MLQFQSQQWNLPPQSFANEHGCGETIYVNQAWSSGAGVWDPTPPQPSDCASLDTNKLQQRLGNLLFEMASSSGSSSGWMKTQNEAGDTPLALMDKPQTAPPPGSPSGLMVVAPTMHLSPPTPDLFPLDLDGITAAFSNL